MFQVEVSDIDSINDHWALGNVVESEQKWSNRRLSTTWVSHDGHWLIGLNSQVELFEHELISRGVSEVHIPELNTASQLVSDTLLLWVDLGLLFNDTEYSPCSLLRLWDAGHLADGDAASNSADKDHIATSECLLSLLCIVVELLTKEGSHKEDESNKYESDCLGVAEEKTWDVCFLDVGLMGHHQEQVVPLQHEIHILLTETDHSPVIND